MLESVEWGEYRLGDLFEIKISKSIDEGKLKLSPNNQPGYIEFVGRTMLENGVKGYTKELSFKPNPPGVISVSQIGTITAQIRSNYWYASQNIFLLSPKGKKYEGLSSLFGVVAINKALEGSFDSGYSNYPTLQTLQDLKIRTPIQIDVIDYEFMERFIAELNAYLSITGLKDYTLTPEEEQALQCFESNHIEWSEFKMEKLFRRRDTKKLSYKAKELPKEPKGEYSLPCLTSSFLNQGLNYYAPRKDTSILKDVISIPSNSDVYRAYYQSRDFTVLSDAYAIEWEYGNIKISPKQYLFLVSSINKVTDLPIYSYKNKLGGWNVVKEKEISLPIFDDEIDYALMQTLISAIEKLAIKDVVLYADREIEATKNVIDKTSKSNSI